MPKVHRCLVHVGSTHIDATIRRALCARDLEVQIPRWISRWIPRRKFERCLFVALVDSNLNQPCIRHYYISSPFRIVKSRPFLWQTKVGCGSHRIQIVLLHRFKKKGNKLKFRAFDEGIPAVISRNNVGIYRNVVSESMFFRGGVLFSLESIQMSL